ncbi:histidine kinase [Paenibacillus sp. N4]|uniref:sensor histidine kinase n=1 Tax=Paenibacillus vietnamensis TaxID=2590547 RepID=UPI001CD14B94|nr:histidine kinase [Paenibacillus vietnamensis]MCA0755901.1 histidine kinase [Paenibacillus vietnamensis]
MPLFKGSLQVKFILACLLVVLPFATLLFLVNRFSMNNIREEIINSNTNLMRLYMASLDTSLQKINDNLSSVQRSSDDLNLVSKYEPGSRPYIYSKYKAMESLKQVLVYTPQADFLFLYMQKSKDLASTDQSIGSGPGRTGWLEVLDRAIETREFYSWQTIHDANSFGLISVVEAAPSVYIGAWVGSGNVMAPFRQMDLGDRGQVVALSKQYEVLASMKEQSFLKQEPSFFRKRFPVSEEEGSKLRYVQVSRESSMADLLLTVLIPESILLKNLLFFERLFYLIILAVIVMLAIYVAVLRTILIKPIRKLIKGMRLLEEGRLDIRIRPEKTLELSQLIEAFNRMASEIRHLKIDVYEEKNRSLRAEYKQLQAQINPHFYLNSLNIVYNLVALRNYDTVKKLILHISEYFRFITRTEKELITIGEEIGHVRNYMGIQMLRFPDQIRFECDMDEEAGSALLPPLSLQPFVENAVVHGFTNPELAFVIRLEVCLHGKAAEGGCFVDITVSDNGTGFSPELLEQLQNLNYFNETQEGHLGIWNIYRRLSMRYGGRTAASFANADGGGAIIRLRIPYETEGGQEHV